MNSSKEYYLVPVYLMIAEDIGYGDVEFEFLDNIIVFKTKKGYEELDGFNNFVILKSEKQDSKRLVIINSSESLILNEDDIKEENKVDIYNLYKENENLRGYSKANEDIDIKYYNKDNFNNFVKVKRVKRKALGGNR